VTEIPLKLFEAEPALNAFLRTEMSYALSAALDAYAVSGIQASAPPTGKVGMTLVEQIRRAVAASRALGANPNVLVLDAATDAVDLDLATDPASGYIFAPRATGSSSPIWGMTVVEAPAATNDPLLIDTTLAAQLYLGGAAFSVDPYTGFKRNLVDCRLEFSALLVVRDVNGLYLVA